MQQSISSPTHAEEVIKGREHKLKSEILKQREADRPQDSSLQFNREAIVKYLKEKHKAIPDFDKEKSITDSSMKAGLDSTALVREAKKLDSLKVAVREKETKLRAFQKKAVDSIAGIKRRIAAITSGNDLSGFMKNELEGAENLTTAQKILLSIRKIGVGQNWIDYSELTVKNISLTGVNIEANPGNLYIAAATGKVNYRFRDFIVRNGDESSSQSLHIVRAGYGQKDKNSVILTLYNGRKSLFSAVGVGGANTEPITGMSIESRYALDADNYVSAEIARSSYADYQSQPATGGAFRKIFDFDNNANQAWCIKAGSNYKTGTRITGSYKRMGEAFESFTLAPSNSRQDAWLVTVNQSLYKGKLLVDASVRKNQFESPIAAPGYSASTVFKSLQVTARFPKYPFVSAGYYPSTQLMAGANNTLYQTQYNTINVIASHSYKVHSLNMNTNVAYTRFYNSSSDTGFIYANAESYTVSHSLFLDQLVLEGIFTAVSQPQTKVLSAQPIARYQLKQIINISAGIKWNQLNGDQTMWGGTAGLTVQFKRLGVLQLQYDKIHLPTYNQSLLPVDMGRLIFSRQF